MKKKNCTFLDKMKHSVAMSRFEPNKIKRSNSFPVFAEIFYVFFVENKDNFWLSHRPIKLNHLFLPKPFIHLYESTFKPSLSTGQVLDHLQHVARNFVGGSVAWLARNLGAVGGTRRTRHHYQGQSHQQNGDKGQQFHRSKKGGRSELN